jgi:hypothetical protein
VSCANCDYNWTTESLRPLFPFTSKILHETLPDTIPANTRAHPTPNCCIDSIFTPLPRQTLACRPKHSRDVSGRRPYPAHSHRSTYAIPNVLFLVVVVFVANIRHWSTVCCVFEKLQGITKLGRSHVRPRTHGHRRPTTPADDCTHSIASRDKP